MIYCHIVHNKYTQWSRICYTLWKLKAHFSATEQDHIVGRKPQKGTYDIELQKLQKPCFCHRTLHHCSGNNSSRVSSVTVDVLRPLTKGCCFSARVPTLNRPYLRLGVLSSL